MTCRPSPAGLAEGTIQTNQAGDGRVTLQADRLPGATGAWVMVFDDVSGQVYTSNTVAANRPDAVASISASRSAGR